MHRSEFWRMAACAGALAILGCGPAGAQTLATAPAKSVVSTSEGGHEEQVMIDPSLHRFMGTVTALEKPDAQGHSYSFRLAPVGPKSRAPGPDEFRGWRLTMLSGKRFPAVFEISANTSSEVTVVSGKSPVDGIGVHDMFIIESMDATGKSLFAPAGGAASGD